MGFKKPMQQQTETSGHLGDKITTSILGQQSCQTSQQSMVSTESGASSADMGMLRQTIAATSGCLCMFITGCWLAWPSPSLKNLLSGNARLTLDEEQASWVVAWLDVGNMISPLPVAYLVDKLGRKTLMLSTGPIFLACSLLTFPTGTPYFLYLARFLSGLCKGITFTVVPMYLGEIASVKIRGALSTLAIGFIWGGTLLIFCIGPMISYDTLNIILGVFPVIFMLAFLRMPQSPYSLLMRDKYSGARSSLLWLRNDSDQTDKELTAMKENVDEDMKSKGSYLELLTVSTNRKATTIVMLMSAFQRLCGTSCLLAYSSTTLPSSSGLPFLGQNEVIMVFGLFLTLSNFIATPLVDSLGRKPLLLLSCAGTALCTATSGVYYLLVPQRDSLGWIPYSALLVFGSFQAIGLGVIPSTFVAELFPSNVKAKAAAMSSIMLALASFLTNKMYVPVKHNFGVHYMFFFFAASSIVGFFFTVCYVFETKGKTFPEIQERLKNK